MFLFAYLKAKKNGDVAELKKISDEYVRFVESALVFNEGTGEKLFGRQISQILLLHANEVTSKNLDRLLQIFKQHGYRFVTLETALRDPVYVFPEKYTPTSDWLRHWAISKDKDFVGPAPPDFIQRAYAESQSAK